MLFTAKAHQELLDRPSLHFHFKAATATKVNKTKWSERDHPKPCKRLTNTEWQVITKPLGTHMNVEAPETLSPGTQPHSLDTFDFLFRSY